MPQDRLHVAVADALDLHQFMARDQAVAVDPYEAAVELFFQRLQRLLDEVLAARVVHHHVLFLRLQVQWRRQEPLPWSLPLPRLVLQPLVENAVLHGISRLPEGGILAIELQAMDERLHIRIRNPSPSPEAEGFLVHRGAGHAQRSIAHRLAYRFGPGAKMTAQWSDGYYACEIVLPLTAA